MRKVIINLCPTGIVPTKEQTPHVPISPKEIIMDALLCAKLGASIVHIHARDKNGKYTWEKGVYAEIIEGIKNENPDLIICVSTSGRKWSDLGRRTDCLLLKDDLKPDMASLTMGSFNFMKDPSINEPKIIGSILEILNELEIKPELEIFEAGMIHKANYLINKEKIYGIPYFNLFFGSLGTAPLEPTTIASFLNLLPSNAVWSMAGIGRYQLESNIAGLLFGGNVRIGLEDNIWHDKNKKRQTRNSWLVERIVDAIHMLDLEIAKPLEARKILGL